MKKKEFYYVDRDGNYHRRTRKPVSHGSRHDPFPWLGLLLAVALLAGVAGAFRYLNHRSMDQTVAAAPGGGQPTSRVEVEAGPLELADNAALEADADGLLPSVEELFHDVDDTSDGALALSADAGDAPSTDAGAMIVGFGTEEGDAAQDDGAREEGEAAAPAEGAEAGTGDAAETEQAASGMDGETAADADTEAGEAAEGTEQAVPAEGEEAAEDVDKAPIEGEEAAETEEAAEDVDKAPVEGEEAAETGEAAEDADKTPAEGEEAAEAGEAAEDAEASPAEDAESADPAPTEAGAVRLVRDDPAYLPIAEGVETERKVVAIVIESCGNTGNLETMLSLLSKQGGAVTLCPAGENLSDKRLVSALREAAEGGAEIEAMDWSTKYLYQMTDQEMAETIWKEGQAINEVLGKSYQPHFYRMRDSLGEVDQRAHDYLDQLGYRAVLHGTAESWTMAASSLRECVRPGAVLLFKTGRTELRNLKELLPWLKKEGYALVTLNGLFGLPANETAPLAEAEMPQPRAFEPSYRTLRKGDCGFEVLAMQNRLKELGLLKPGKDGTACFGDRTVAAVRAFQKDQSLEQTGEADPETRRRLMGEDESASDAVKPPAEGEEPGEEADAARTEEAGEASAEAEEPEADAARTEEAGEEAAGTEKPESEADVAGAEEAGETAAEAEDAGAETTEPRSGASDGAAEA